MTFQDRLTVMIVGDLTGLSARQIARCIVLLINQERKRNTPRMSRIRRNRRDTLIREAAKTYDGGVTHVAKTMAADLVAYETNGWPRERDMPAPADPCSERRRLMHAILRTGARALGARQVLNIVEGHRGRLGQVI